MKKDERALDRLDNYRRMVAELKRETYRDYKNTMVLGRVAGLLDRVMSDIELLEADRSNWGAEGANK